MKNSPKVKMVSKKVLNELLAMSPKELSSRLEKREIGPVGQLLLETDT